MKLHHFVRLAALVFALGSGCDSSDRQGTATADAATDITEYLGAGVNNSNASSFARAIAPRDFHFPRDHGSHTNFRTEWWYFTGNLFTNSRRHFGFQLTFFRLALEPPGHARKSAFAAHQLWMAHFTVTDTEGRQFYVDESFERDALGLAGVTTEPFRLWLNGWSAASSERTFFPLKLAANTVSTGIELRLDAGKPLVLQGDAGLDRKGEEAGAASYYYSHTRMPVTGEIRVGDESFSVDGLGWMDREWSTSVLGRDLEGWDWFSLQLDDGSDVMFYRLRRHDQSMSPFSGGVHVSADGETVTHFGADNTRLVPTDTWTSPASGVRYNTAWRLSIADVDLDLAIEPRLENQELSLSVRYWEGSIVATGTRAGLPVRGNGYAEYAGVAKR